MINAVSAMDDRRLSVAETLEQAKKALQTHRAWMKRRVSLSPSVFSEEDTSPDSQEHQVNLGIFTSDKNTQLKLEEVTAQETEPSSMSEHTERAPPTSRGHSTERRRGSKVAPASLAPDEGDISTTSSPAHFYGSFQGSVPDKIHYPSLDGETTGSSPKRKRRSSASKSQVVPRTGIHDNQTPPTSPTSAFYGTSLEHSIPHQSQNAWTPEDAGPDLEFNTADKTGKYSLPTHPHYAPHNIRSHNNHSSLSTIANSLISPDAQDHSSDLDLSTTQAESLQAEGQSHIVPVSPAPKDQRGSYSAHIRSTVKAAEESLEIINREGEERVSSPSGDPAPAFRLPAPTSGARQGVKIQEIGGTFLRRVLPRDEKLESNMLVTHHKLPTSPTDNVSSPVNGLKAEQTIPEDIETVDLFSAPTRGHHESTKLEPANDHFSNSNKPYELTKPECTETSSQEGKESAVYAPREGTTSHTQKSDRLRIEDVKSANMSTGSLNSHTKPSNFSSSSKDSIPSLEVDGLAGATTKVKDQTGTTSIVAGVKGHAEDDEKLKELKLPLLKEVPSATVLEGSELVRQLPMLKSPLTPYTTGFMFHSKRERAPPSYTIHRRRGSMGLAPPCPLYRVTQPKGLGAALSLTLTEASDDYTDSPAGHTTTKTVNSLVTPTEHAHKEEDQSPPSAQELDTVQARAMVGPNVSMSGLPSGPGPLHLAAKSGNLRRLQALINQGHDVDLPDQNGQTPLMYCIHTNGVHLSCADALIKEGANVNKQSSDGSTAMHLASSVGGVALIELMILNGARTDVRDFDGRLPIHWATIQRRSTKVIATLLEHSELGIDVTDDVGMTPLMWSAYNNNVVATSFLLERGADREEKDSDGYTAMHWGVHKDGTQCLQLLLKPDMTYFKDHKGKTVILFAAEKGAMAACELILKMRPDAIYDTDKMVRTPLHYAAACSHVDVCALLLDRGADASQKDSTGRTPLDYARLKKMDYVVALLTCHGTAVADFARASRSTSVASFLNRSINFGQESDMHGSIASLASLQSRLKSSLVKNETASVEGEGVRSGGGDATDIMKGGYLGRFVSDKTDPIRHYFFRLHPELGTISWAADRSGRSPEHATVLEVHEGPSNTVKHSTAYSPDELHKYVFWVLTAGGVLDLLAYNQDDYSVWVHETRQLAVSNAQHGDIGQALRRQQRIKGSGVPSRPSSSHSQVAPASLAGRTQWTEESGETPQSKSLDSSKLFIRSHSSPIPTPLKEERSGNKRQVAPVHVTSHMTSQDDHMTSHVTGIPPSFRSDIFMTSTPKPTILASDDII